MPPKLLLLDAANTKIQEKLILTSNATIPFPFSSLVLSLEDEEEDVDVQTECHGEDTPI